MTVTTRPRKRRRSAIKPNVDQNLNSNGNYDDALQALLERLQAIRSEAIALRDEHYRSAAEIEERIATRELAASAATKVKPVRTDFAVSDYTLEVQSSQAPKPYIPPSPALPALKLLTEHEPSEKLIREQSIIIRAQAITRKNAELARERLPKQPEAQKNKTWHDYFVDEAVWMATDFREERKWKIQVAKKLAKSVMQYHTQRANRDARAKLEEHHRKVKAANSVARDVRKFWSQIREIANFRYSRVEKARKIEESQQQLNKFLEKTQAYSDQLASRFRHSARLQNNMLVDQVKQVKFADNDVEGNVIEKSNSIVPELIVPRSRETPSIAPHLSITSKRSSIPSTGSTDKHDFVSSDAAWLSKSSKAGSITQPAEVPTCASNQHQLPGSPPQNVTTAKERGGETKSSELVQSGIKIPGKNITVGNSCEGPAQKLQEKRAESLGSPACDPAHAEKRDSSVSKVLKHELNCESSYSQRINGHKEKCFNKELRAQRPKLDACHSSVDFVAPNDKALEDGCTDEQLKSRESSIRMPVELLRGSLRDYQVSGMHWLINLHKSKSNGILADEMGLGKTIQTIALLAWLAIEKELWGPHLIIVPTSVMVNWEVEFKRWLPGFKILTYFGSIKERKQKRKGWTDPELFHVCITSYTLAVQDNFILRRKKWVYLILDEAHNIKNFKSQRWQTLLNFSAQHRLLLTGTPLQNSVMELWSLMHFLMPSLFESHSEFKDWFSNPLQNTYDSQPQSAVSRAKVVEQLHVVLRPFLLRRLKSEVEKDLPPKHEHIIKCHLGKRQRQLYEDFMARSDVLENLKSGDLFKVMNVLMQLRKVCNHPDLFEGRPILSPYAMAPIFYPIPSSVVGMCYQPSLEKINLNLLSLDLCSEELVWPGKWYSEECERISSEQLVRDMMLKQALADDKLLNMGKNILSAVALGSREKIQAFRREAMYHLAVISAHRIRARGLLGEDTRAACLMTPSSLLDSLRFNSSPLGDFVPHNTSKLVTKLDYMSERARAASEQFVFCVTKASAPLVELRYQGDDAHYSSGLELLIEFNMMSSAYRSLFRSFDVRSQVTIPDKRLVQWDCGKLQVLDVLLRKLMLQNSRVLIFTQMTKVLDVLEAFLNLHTYLYLRLDGTTKTDDRQKLVQRFNSDKRIFCMILTTRAGGVGLNLTGADSVVFYDTDYNPAIDNQAQDRAHRIGQTKPVNIYRLICEQTVEENILRRATEKRCLENQIISEAGFTTNGIKCQKQGEISHQQHPMKSKELGLNVQSSSQPDSTNCPKNGINVKSYGYHGSSSGREFFPSEIVSGVESAHGTFHGFCVSGYSGHKEKHSDIERSDTANIKSEDDFECLTDNLLAGNDEREQIARHAAEQERAVLEAEFNDSEEEGFKLCDGPKSLNDGADVEQLLKPIQKFALRLVEEWHYNDESDEDGCLQQPSFHGILHDVDKFSLTAHGSKDSGVSDCDAVITDRQNVRDNDFEDELFYELDVSDEGRLNYLKALTDADVDIKLYLPLRDGGPEELKVSTVVCGTAAAGLECAEDAAFFPHAYNRMSRTPYATKRQREKSRSIYLKKMVEKRQREMEMHHGDTLNGERQGSVAGPLESNVLTNLNQASVVMNAAIAVAAASSVGRSKAVDKEKQKGIVDKLNQKATTIAACKSVLGVIPSTVAARLVHDPSKKNVVACKQNNARVFNESNLSLQPSDIGFSARCRALEKSRGTTKPRELPWLSTSTPSNDPYGNIGLFKKVVKKSTKKPNLNVVKSARGITGNSLSESVKSDSGGWTKNEDEELMKLAEEYSNNMQLVSDLLSNNEKVIIGARRRRGREHCTDRLLKCLGKGKSSQSGPIATLADSEMFYRHILALKRATESEKHAVSSFIAAPPAKIEQHPTQAAVISKAKSKTPGFTVSKSTYPSLDEVESKIVAPQHHKPGMKPTETTPGAIHRKKYPYMAPSREEVRLEGKSVSLKSNHYGSGYQVSGGATGDTIVVSTPSPVKPPPRKGTASIQTPKATALRNTVSNAPNSIKASISPSTLEKAGTAVLAANSNLAQGGSRMLPKVNIAAKGAIAKPGNDSVVSKLPAALPVDKKAALAVVPSNSLNSGKGRGSNTQPVKQGVSLPKACGLVFSGQNVEQKRVVSSGKLSSDGATVMKLGTGLNNGPNGNGAVQMGVGRVATNTPRVISGTSVVGKTMGRGKATSSRGRPVGNGLNRGTLVKNRSVIGETNVGAGVGKSGTIVGKRDAGGATGSNNVFSTKITGNGLLSNGVSQLGNNNSTNVPGVVGNHAVGGKGDFGGDSGVSSGVENIQMRTNHGLQRAEVAQGDGMTNVAVQSGSLAKACVDVDAVVSGIGGKSCGSHGGTRNVTNSNVVSTSEVVKSKGVEVKNALAAGVDGKKKKDIGAQAGGPIPEISETKGAD